MTSDDPTETTRAALDWPGAFSVQDPDPSDHHSPLYLVFPNGLMVNISSDDRPGMDISRGEWMAGVLNAALSAPSEAGETLEANPHRLRALLSEMAHRCSVDMTLWNAFSNEALRHADRVEALARQGEVRREASSEMERVCEDAFAALSSSEDSRG